MVLDEQVKYNSLNHWFTTQQGRRVSEAFDLELHKIVDGLSGQSLLQLGVCGDNRWLTDLNFRHKWLVTPVIHEANAALCASIHALPLERNSVDCVVAPLTLEMSSSKRNPMNEIDRVLKPMGYAIFFGVNPWSFWGLAFRLRRIYALSHTPIHLGSSLSLKHALDSRGYRQCAFSSFYYTPPFQSEKVIQKLEFLNEMGKMMWPYPAGFYCLIAQKFDYCMTNLQPESSLYLAKAVSPS